MPDPEFALTEEAVMTALDLDPGTREMFLADLHRRDPILHGRVARLVALEEDSRRLLATLSPDRQEGRTGSEPVDPLVGEQIGGFRLRRLIGAGGMGRVYESRQSAPDRRVAIKVIVPRAWVSAELARFRREAELMGSLDHPGICRVFQAGTGVVSTHRAAFIVMEYLEGRRLDLALAAREVRAKLEILAQVCDAVAHAHAHGVLHRDLKPANILVVEGGHSEGATAKVLDFGVARPAEGLSLVSELTETGQLVGTIPYMSPELLEGNPATVLSDVFALGVIIFEVLSGRRQLHLDDVLRHAGRNVGAELQRAASDQPVLRGDLRVIIAKATDAEPSRRYQSAADLAQDLRRHLENRPIKARRASLGYRVVKFTRRNRRLTVVGALAAVAVLIAGAVAATSVLEARQLTEARRFGRYVAAIQEAHTAIKSDDVVHARRVLADADEDLRGWEWAYLRGIADQSEQVFRIPGALMSQDAVPSLMRTNSGDDGLTIQIGSTSVEIDTALGTIRTVAPSGGSLGSVGNAGSVTSPDGRIRAEFGASNVRLVGTAPEVTVPTLHGGDEPTQCAVFSHDSALLAAGVGTSVCVWELKTGERIARLRGHSGRVTSLAAAGAEPVLWSCSTDGTVRRWKFGYPSDSDRFVDPAARLNHDVQFATSYHADSKTLDILDLTRPEPLVTLGSIPHAPWQFALTKDRRIAVLAGMGDTHAIIAMDVASGKEISRRSNFNLNDSVLSIDPTGQRVALAGEDGVVRLFSLPDLSPAIEIRETAKVDAAVFSPDGQRLAVSFFPSGLRVHRVSDGAVVAECDTRGGMAIYPVFSDDGSLVIGLNYRELNLNLWDATTGRLERRVVIPENPMSLTRLSGTGRVAVGCVGGAVRMFAVSTPTDAPWEPVLILRETDSTVNALASSQDASSMLGFCNSQVNFYWRLRRAPETVLLRMITRPLE